VEVAIGVDPSKSSLAVAAVDPLGRVVGTAAFPNDSRGYRTLLRWARERSPDRVIGIECSLSFGATLSRLLLRSGEDVREVPTTLTHQQRRRRASQGKSDLVDSVAIARIVASGEVLPSAHRLEVRMRRILDLEKTVRRLQAKLSGFEALEVERLKLKAEIASLRKGGGKTPRRRGS
jgi:Transposase